MIFKWSLVVLVLSCIPGQVKSEDPPTEADDKALNTKINELIILQEGEKSAELISKLRELSDASNLKLEDYAKKKKIIDDFEIYNNKRLELEKKIKTRTTELDKIISEEKGKACKVFYEKQKKKLLEVLKESNATKEYVYGENIGNCDIDCGNSDDDNTYSYDYYDYYN
ncbi:hypothetical protein KR222_001288 [Zaprionus bogoriensis]|nr:hypothetical protein KR222_001288 [Zaprionus bogoriensis]